MEGHSEENVQYTISSATNELLNCVRDENKLWQRTHDAMLALCNGDEELADKGFKPFDEAFAKLNAAFEHELQETLFNKIFDVTNDSNEL